MAHNKNNFFWEVGSLPFYYRPLETPHNDTGIPNILPFQLSVDRSTGTLTQNPTQELLDALMLVYSKGSEVSGMMDDEGIGKEYADDFIEFMRRSLSFDDLNEHKVLEIGCGTGYLLHRLQLLGAECIGIEPGAHSRDGAEKYGVKIIHDFFPSKQLRGNFDFIILYGVLEHICDPAQFLLQVKQYLVKNGNLIIAVEDEESYIGQGDLSILFHEHFSYFTEETLCKTLRGGGYKANISMSSFSKLLYANCRTHHYLNDNSSEENCNSTNKAVQFKKKAKLSIKKFSGYILDSIKKNESVGIYVPGRAVNILTMSQVPVTCIRFFDDNPKLHSTYFAGTEIPIESRQELKNNPTDRLLIMSSSFGEKIARELSDVLPKNTIIKTWQDLF